MQLLNDAALLDFLTPRNNLNQPVPTGKTLTQLIRETADTRPNLRASPFDRARTFVEQLALNRVLGLTPPDALIPDGIAGPATLYVVELYHNWLRDHGDHIPAEAPYPTPHTPVFPTQNKVSNVYGPPGAAACHAPVKTLYPLRMDGSLSKTAILPLGTPGAPAPITRIALHEQLHESFRKVQIDILAHYGLGNIVRLGLDQYAGSYNYRPMRGGTNLSMHAWGIAIDWDAQRNGLHQTLAQSQFGKPEYKDFLDIWEAHGWLSLGRARNYDSMHVQAARL